MNKYYVLRCGAEFKTVFIDAATVGLLVKAGWELETRPYESQYEALLAIALENW